MCQERRQEGLHKPESRPDVCDVLRALQKDLRGMEEPPVFWILPCWQGSRDNVQSLTHWTLMKFDVRVVERLELGERDQYGEIQHPDLIHMTRRRNGSD